MKIELVLNLSFISFISKTELNLSHISSILLKVNAKLRKNTILKSKALWIVIDFLHPLPESSRTSQIQMNCRIKRRVKFSLTSKVRSKYRISFDLVNHIASFDPIHYLILSVAKGSPLLVRVFGVFDDAIPFQFIDLSTVFIVCRSLR